MSGDMVKVYGTCDTKLFNVLIKDCSITRL